MTLRSQTPLHLMLAVLGCVLFAIAAFGWRSPLEPWRTKIIAAGLFFWTLSKFFL